MIFLLSVSISLSQLRARSQAFFKKSRIKMNLRFCSGNSTKKQIAPPGTRGSSEATSTARFRFWQSNADWLRTDAAADDATADGNANCCQTKSTGATECQRKCSQQFAADGMGRDTLSWHIQSGQPNYPAEPDANGTTKPDAAAAGKCSRRRPRLLCVECVNKKY